MFDVHVCVCVCVIAYEDKSIQLRQLVQRSNYC
jgi:hypothetical protein